MTIYLIHGAGFDDTHWESLGLFQVMDFDPLKMADEPTLKTQRIFLDAGDRDACKMGADEQHLALENSEVAHVYRIWPGVHENALWAAHLGDYLNFYTQAWPQQQ